MHKIKAVKIKQKIKSMPKKKNMNRVMTQTAADAVTSMNKENVLPTDKRADCAVRKSLCKNVQKCSETAKKVAHA